MFDKMQLLTEAKVRALRGGRNHHRSDVCTRDDRWADAGEEGIIVAGDQRAVARL